MGDDAAKLNKFLIVLLGTAAAVRLIQIIKGKFESEIRLNVFEQLMIQKEAINNAPFFKRCGIAVQILRGKL